MAWTDDLHEQIACLQHELETERTRAERAEAALRAVLPYFDLQRCTIRVWSGENEPHDVAIPHSLSVELVQARAVLGE